jgi:membrane-associated phospholipid phosphatase
MSSVLSRKRKIFYHKLEGFLRKFHMEASLLIFVEIIVGGAVSIASFLLFAEFAEEVLESDGLHLDTQISHAVYSIRTPWLTDVMQGLSFIGGEFLFYAALAITTLLFIKKYKREAIVFASAIIIGQFLNLLIKFLLKVPRPNIDPIALANFYSFPSGHAMSSFIFFASITYLVFHFTRKNRLSLLVACCSAVMVLLIGFSRVYLGVHYPSDIVAGYIAGFWWFITVIVLDKTIHFYRLFRNTRKK